MFDDVVTVSVEFNGHKFREEAALALMKKSDKKERVIIVQVRVILQIWFWTAGKTKQDS